MCLSQNQEKKYVPYLAISRDVKGAGVCLVAFLWPNYASGVLYVNVR